MADSRSEAIREAERELKYLLAGRTRADRKHIVSAVCDCARITLRHVPRGARAPRAAVEAAEAWVRNGATADDVRAAAFAADAAARAVGDADASAPMDAAANAASVVWALNPEAAAFAHGCVVSVAYTVANHSDDFVEAYLLTLQRCVKIARAHLRRRAAA